MIHLTETGFYAGRRLCPTDCTDGDTTVHAVYAPLNRDEFRAKCCAHCLIVWAREAYEDGDDMPEWVRIARTFEHQDATP